MRKQNNNLPALPAKRLKRLLELQSEYDHTNQELADLLVTWLKAVSTLPIEDQDIHVLLGGSSRPMTIIIDRIGTEIAEGLTHYAPMEGLLLLVEPSLCMVGDMLFNATSERIADDASYTSTLSINVVRCNRTAFASAIDMIVPTKAPKKVRNYPEALTIAYMTIGAKQVLNEPGFRLPADHGELEFIDSVIIQASLLDSLAEGREFKGVFLYDVAQPFGEFVARNIGLSANKLTARAEELIAAAC